MNVYFQRNIAMQPQVTFSEWLLKGQVSIATSSPWNKFINQVIVSNDGGENFDLIHGGLPDGRPRKNTMWGQGDLERIGHRS